MTEGRDIPLHLVAAGADRHDAKLLGATLAGLDRLDSLLDDVTVHLDRAYDGANARVGVPAPVRAGLRRVVERAHNWMNGYGKLRRCTEKLAPVVDFYLFPAAALIVIRQLIQRACATAGPPGPPPVL